MQCAIISPLLTILYEKSMETEEHSKRIEVNCHSIGWKLQLSSKEMDELSLLAVLHDIRKVEVNPNILKKPAPLTPAEWEEMKRHPEIGHRIVQAIPGFADIADFILLIMNAGMGKAIRVVSRKKRFLWSVASLPLPMLMML